MTRISEIFYDNSKRCGAEFGRSHMQGVSTRDRLGCAPNLGTGGDLELFLSAVGVLYVPDAVCRSFAILYVHSRGSAEVIRKNFASRERQAAKSRRGRLRLAPQAELTVVEQRLRQRRAPGAIARHDKPIELGHVGWWCDGVSGVYGRVYGCRIDTLHVRPSRAATQEKKARKRDKRE
jgi:hypothetical protein